MPSILQCIDCAEQYPIERVIYSCAACGGLLDVQHDLSDARGSISRNLFDGRLGTYAAPYNSGVWRYKELVYPVGVALLALVGLSQFRRRRRAAA